MKVTATLFSLALASVAVAQLGDLPTCAQVCVEPVLSGQGVGDCGTDPKCICGNDQFIKDISCCLAANCQPPDQTSAVGYASKLCGALGVTTLPTTVSCATITSGAAPTGSGSTTRSGSATTTPTGAAANTGSSSGNYGPRQTAAAGLGALGGLVAAVALL